jgi:hypothetical protein
LWQANFDSYNALATRYIESEEEDDKGIVVAAEISVVDFPQIKKKFKMEENEALKIIIFSREYPHFYEPADGDYSAESVEKWVNTLRSREILSLKTEVIKQCFRK